MSDARPTRIDPRHDRGPSSSRRTIARQLRRAGVDEATIGDVAGMVTFLELLEETYDEFDRQRRLAEHASRVAAGELEELVASLRTSEGVFRSLARCSPNGIVYTDVDGRCAYANEQAAELFGRDAGELSGLGWWSSVHRGDRHLVRGVLDVAQLGVDVDESSTARSAIEVRVVVGDERATIWASVTTAPVVDEGRVVGWIANLEDVTARRLQDAELERLANHDGLTQLLNRRAFGERLDRLLARSARGEAGGCVAVALVDLDGFKAVNDTHGHEAGDHVLTVLAHRLLEVTGAGDLVCRLGGDEFAVASVVDPVRGPERFARAIGRAVHGSVELAGGEVVAVGGAVGVAPTGDGRATTSSLLRAADAAMYRAKRHPERAWSVAGDASTAELADAPRWPSAAQVGDVADGVPPRGDHGDGGDGRSPRGGSSADGPLADRSRATSTVHLARLG